MQIISSVNKSIFNSKDAHPTTQLPCLVPTLTYIYILYDVVSDKWMPHETIAIDLACPALKLYDHVT
jgi:hypothetical protein